MRARGNASEIENGRNQTRGCDTRAALPNERHQHKKFAPAARTTYCQGDGGGERGAEYRAVENDRAACSHYRRRRRTNERPVFAQKIARN